MAAVTLTVADFVVATVVVVVVLGLLLWSSIDAPIGDADDGYLCYGALEVDREAVPVRDFRSYEPGRYWWTVPFLRVLGRGLATVRVAATAMLAGGLLAVVMALRGTGQGWVTVIVTAVVVAAWSLHPHKRFDRGMLLAVVAAMIWAITDPSPWSLAIAGGAVGLAAVAGVNLALYGAVAAGLTLLVVARRPDAGLVEESLWMGGGIVVGSAPRPEAAVDSTHR